MSYYLANKSTIAGAIAGEGVVVNSEFRRQTEFREAYF